MKNLNFLVWLCFLFVAPSISFGQQKVVITKIPKFKPPAVKTFLGINQNGAQVTPDEGNQLVGLPLKIVDDKNNVYPISTYRFLYKEKGYIVDDETGKNEVTFNNVADRFDKTPLPKIWTDNIKGRLQKDEQLYFFDIVVKDKEGREFYAPELKITIK